MTTNGARLRAAEWPGWAPVLLLAMGCTSARSVIPTAPVGSPDAGASDVGTGVIDAGRGTSDAREDGPGGGGADAAKPDTGTICGAGAHACSGQCVSNTDVAHCAQGCSPCVIPSGGTATCDGTACGATCPTGTKLCGAACVPQATSCGVDCPGGSHDCGGSCQPNTAVANCGASCTPCVPPAHGTGTCDGVQCGLTCAAGYHACGAQCLSNTDVASCGSSCSPCATPVGGTVTCDGTSCGGTCPSGTKLCAGSCIPAAQTCLGSCAAGAHNCNGICQSNTSPNSCGVSSCTPCLPPANAVATCDGSQCGSTCSVGYHLCGSACLPNSGVDHCGTTSCTACTPPANAGPTCDGLACGFQCVTGFHACGSSCSASNSVQSCGFLCSPCPVPANGTATCSGTSCGVACNAGFHNCGGLCVSSTSLLSCGSSCTPCPTPTTGTATCDGTSCGVNIPNFNLMVSTAGIGGATGTVTTSPAGTSCGAGCLGFVPGTSVKITAAPASGSLFGGWSDDCAGQGVICTLTLSATRTATAHFRPNKNIAFVTSEGIIPGTIGSSLATADAFCASAAKANFLGGTVWRAWLSTSAATTNINAATHVGASTTGWIRVDGRPIVTNMTNLLAGKMYYPIRVNELGVAPSTEPVTTGTNSDGTPIASGTCADWTSRTGMTYCGSASATTGYWSFAYSMSGDSCGVPFSLYCFENDTGMAAVTAPVSPSNARHAFLSSTLWTPGGGVATADAVCQGDASTTGLPNSANYRALMTTTVAATDASRISLTGQPWYRLDGAQLFVSATDLADPAAAKILTPLNVTPAGEYRSPPDLAWTGNLVAPSSTTMVNNCNNWTSSSASLLGVAGTAYDSWFIWWTFGYMPLEPCSTPEHVYCFER